jgi:hypothetical protein
MVDKVKADALAYMDSPEWQKLVERRFGGWHTPDKDDAAAAEYVRLEEATARLLDDIGEPHQARACRVRAAWGSYAAFSQAHPDGGPLVPPPGWLPPWEAEGGGDDLQVR